MNDFELYERALANSRTEADYSEADYIRSGWEVMWHEAMKIKPPPFVEDGKVMHPTAYGSVRIVEGRVIAELGWCYGQQPLGFSATEEVTQLGIWGRAKNGYTLENAKVRAACSLADASPNLGVPVDEMMR